MTDLSLPSTDWQQWMVLGIICTVLLLFARSAWLRHRGKGQGCGGSCSCSNSALKKLNK